jgi:hypothetical protein
MLSPAARLVRCLALAGLLAGASSAQTLVYTFSGGTAADYFTYESVGDGQLSAVDRRTYGTDGSPSINDDEGNLVLNDLMDFDQDWIASLIFTAPTTNLSGVASLGIGQAIAVSLEAYNDSGDGGPDARGDVGFVIDNPDGIGSNDRGVYAEIFNDGGGNMDTATLPSIGEIETATISMAYDFVNGTTGNLSMWFGGTMLASHNILGGTYSWDPLVSDRIAVRLAIASVGIDDFQSAFPTLDTFTVIPEPGTYAGMIGMTALVFAFVRRRRHC